MIKLWNGESNSKNECKKRYSEGEIEWKAQRHDSMENENGRKTSPSHSNSINQLVDFLVSSSLTFDNFQALQFSGTSIVKAGGWRTVRKWK